MEVVVQWILIGILGVFFVMGFFAIYSHLKSLETMAKSLKQIAEQIVEKKDEK